MRLVRLGDSVLDADQLVICRSGDVGVDGKVGAQLWLRGIQGPGQDSVEVICTAAEYASFLAALVGSGPAGGDPVR
jgi:hypothetical protein